MVYPQINLKGREDEIIRRMGNGESLKDIAAWLNGEGIKLHWKTLQRRVRTWAVLTNQSRTRLTLSSHQLLDKVLQLWRDKSLSDEMIATLITADGIIVTRDQVKDLRYKHGLLKYHISEEDKDTAWQRTLDGC